MIAHSLDRGGGIEAHVRDSAQLMHDEGYEVCVALADHPADVDDLPYETIAIPGLDKRNQPSEGRRSLELAIKEFEPNVIHVHQLLDPTCAAVLRSISPLVWSIHNYSAICMGGQKYFSPGNECGRAHGPGCMSNVLFKGCDHRRVPRPSLGRYRSTGRILAAVQQADMTIVYSRFVGDQLRINSVNRIKRVPLFTQRQGAYKSSCRHQRILFSGRVVPQKGLDVLIQALVMVPNAILDVCGDGWGMPRVQKLARSLGVSSRMRLHGWQTTSQLDAFYEQADVVVVPSVWPEPFGLVGIDAMRHGRAVVASDTGGIRDWLTDGRNGRLVRPGDAAALGGALSWLFNHPDEADDMGRHGAEDVATYFSPEAHLAAIQKAYGAARAVWQERTKKAP